MLLGRKFNTTALLLKPARVSFSRQAAPTLARREVPKERYMNRSEWMANRFKNHNLNAYDWVPEIVTSIDPAPRYMTRPGERERSTFSLKRRMFQEGLEKHKHGLIQKNVMTERATRGRLWAHLKHIEMKN